MTKKRSEREERYNIRKGKEKKGDGQYKVILCSSNVYEIILVSKLFNL